MCTVLHVDQFFHLCKCLVLCVTPRFQLAAFVSLIVVPVINIINSLIDPANFNFHDLVSLATALIQLPSVTKNLLMCQNDIEMNGYSNMTFLVLIGHCPLRETSGVHLRPSGTNGCWDWPPRVAPPAGLIRNDRNTPGHVRAELLTSKLTTRHPRTLF